LTDAADCPEVQRANSAKQGHNASLFEYLMQAAPKVYLHRRFNIGYRTMRGWEMSQ